MADLTPRQEQAQALCRELQRLGAVVTNPMPLERDRHLTFQVLDAQRDAVLRKVGEWGWSVALLSTGPRFCHDGVKPASIYELHIEAEREKVPQDNRIMKDEVAATKKSQVEVERVRAYLGLK